MAKNRKAAEKYIIEKIGLITNGDEFNINLYKETFKNMTDKEFDLFMNKLKDGTILNIIINGKETKINIEHALKVAKQMGYDPFQYIYLGPSDDEPKRKSLHKYFNLILPFRRMKQTVEKGVSVTSNMNHIDNVTGQVTGESLAASMSFPEVQVLSGMGLNETAKEFMSDRGGDVAKINVMKNVLSKYGKVDSTTLDAYASGVGSTKALKAYFNGMMYKINLTD